MTWDEAKASVLAEAWWRGRCSANARQGEWAGPELRERCAKDIADLIEAPPEPLPTAEEMWARTQRPIGLSGNIIVTPPETGHTADYCATCGGTRRTCDCRSSDPSDTRAYLGGIVKGFTAGENASSRHWRERAEQAEAEVQRLSVQVQHCENCGGDYAVTGLSSTCGCEIRAQVWAEAVQVVEQEQARMRHELRANSAHDAFCAILAALRAEGSS